MGVYITFGGVVLAVTAARFSDLLFGYMKLTIIVLMVIATGGYTWFLLLMNKCLPFSKGWYILFSIVKKRKQFKFQFKDV